MKKVVKSHPKTAVLGNKRRAESREELFSVRQISSRDTVSFRRGDRRKNWLEVVIEWFR